MHFFIVSLNFLRLDMMRLPVIHLLRLVVIAMLGALLGACSSTGQPAPLEPSKLDLTVVASDDVNPDDKGRAAPIMVRIYELKTDVAFQEADFFSLQKQDKLILGADMLARNEFILRPGETRTIQRKTHPNTTAIAFLAGYRQLGTATWRTVYKLKPAPEAAWYRAVLPAYKAILKIDLQTSDIKITERD